MTDRAPSSAGDPVDRRRTAGQWWDSTDEMVVVPIADLERVGVAAYIDVGASPDDARFLFRTNLDKAIQGDNARGLVKVPGLIAQARRGDLDVAPNIQVLRDRPGTAIVDGGTKASGRLVSRAAMTLAIEKARTTGIAMVAARGSGELLTAYVRQATDAGMIGMAMVQSVPTVAPHGGRGPLLGNAPFAVGIPAGRLDPLILDMSFTESSASGVLMSARQGQPVPPGVLLDEHGEPTTDATEFPDPVLAPTYGDFCVRGTLVPLGGGHKGYAMVLVLGLLSSLLSDSSPPWELYYHLPERGRYGTLLWAVDPTALTGTSRRRRGATRGRLPRHRQGGADARGRGDPVPGRALAAAGARTARARRDRRAARRRRRDGPARSRARDRTARSHRRRPSSGEAGADRGSRHPTAGGTT